MRTQSLSRQANDDLVLERLPDEECLATFWQQATPGTTYYRCLLPARYLPGQCLNLQPIDLEWDEEKDQLLMPRHSGVAVWQFLGDDARTRVAWALQEQGVRTLLEVDDNYINPHPTFSGQRVWERTIEDSLRPGASGYSNEMHRKIIPTMDGVIVSTPYLASIYGEYNDKVYVCRNAVDPDDWVDLAPKDPETLRIVYSGSISHLHDAPYVTKAFKWAARQPRVEVYVQGFAPKGWTFAKLVPWTDSLAEYRRSLGQFDVGVAPLRPGRWANGRSDLKALEYAMAGVMPLVANEEPFREFGEVFPELLVDSDERAWLDAIKRVVRDRDSVKETTERVRKYVLDNRTMEKCIVSWREAILDQ